MLGNLHAFLSSLDIFQNELFQKSSFKNTISFDPDQALWFVGPGLGPYCLQRLSVADTGRQRVKLKHGFPLPYKVKT